MMTNLLTEVIDISEDILSTFEKITIYESLQIACKIQHNKILNEAYMLGLSSPSALEQIAIQLGAGEGCSIKDAIYNLSK